MSGVEVLAVLSCVGAIVSAFHGGTELLELIKEKRKIKKARRNAETESLEDSLARGPPVVQGEYDRDFRRFGQVFAVGDRIATDALKDIVITLQMTLLQNLQLAWGQETMVDFTTLEYASEESRVNSVVALGQLYQRLATAAPIQRMSATVMPASLLIGNSRPDMPITPPAVTPPAANPRRVRPDSGRWSSEKASRPAIYNLFRKPLSDTAVPHASQESLVPRYLLPAISAEKSDWLLKEVETGNSSDNVGQSISSTMSSDASNSIFDPNDLWQKTWGSPEDSITGAQAQDPRASTSRRRVQTSTLEVATAIPTPKLLLPCEENNFAGFCKARPYSHGAWKLQSGIKKAICERSRPGGMYSATLFWRCQKCMFEGRMAVEPGTKRKTYDTQVHNASGIQWRWLFLFKSHVFLNDILPDPRASTFGCIFCCATGKGTPMFGGVESLMNHLQQHREVQPTGEVLYRMNCVLGRVAEVGEDFDINLPSPGEDAA